MLLRITLGAVVIWTNSGKEKQLEGVLNALFNARLIFYSSDQEIVCEMKWDSDVAKIENGMLSFYEAEGIVMLDKKAVTAVLANDKEELLKLDIDTDITVEPNNYIPGAVLKLKRFIIA